MAWPTFNSELCDAGVVVVKECCSLCDVKEEVVWCCGMY